MLGISGRRYYYNPFYERNRKNERGALTGLH
jgi:hypothetical protein